MSRALEGIRVLELTHVISGSQCGMLLGDLGADVIKMEQPVHGEFYRKDAAKNENGVSVIYPNYNRNKRGVTINIKAPEAKDIIYGLIRQTDIFIENYKPGLLKRLGFGYEDLKKVNPKLIMVSISGYGQTGPYASKPAFDMTISAISGFMSVNGPQGQPTKCGPAISDFLAGIYGALGAIAALRHCEKTGEGQYVDVSMMECSLSILDAYFAQAQVLGEQVRGTGNRRPNYAPVNVFPSKDGNIYIAGSKENQWEALARCMNREDLLTNPLYATREKRKENEDQLEQLVSAWSREYTTRELMDQLDAVNVPCAPIQTIEQVMEDPHVLARHSIEQFDYPGIGAYPTVGFVPKFSSMEVPLERAPLLGEHNEQIYGQLLGYSKQELEEMKARGVI